MQPFGPPRRNLKAKLKPDTFADLKLAIDVVLEKESAYQSCMNCEYFNEAQETCKRYNARPPARVIAFGCPSWNDYDEIPF